MVWSACDIFYLMYYLFYICYTMCVYGVYIIRILPRFGVIWISSASFPVSIYGIHVHIYGIIGISSLTHHSPLQYLQ
jgi:hypothetical protein